MIPTCLLVNVATRNEPRLAALSKRLNFHWYEATPANFSLDAALAQCPQAEIVVSRNVGFSRSQLQRLPQLKALLITSTAYDRVDRVYCAEHQIQVFHTPDYGSQAVAEHAIGLMIAGLKQIPKLHTEVRQGNFYPDGISTQIQGKTLGVVGLGRIGTRIATLSQGLGMTVYYSDPLPKQVAGAHPVSFDQLLQASDVVVLSLPLTEATASLIDDRAIQRMKSSAWLVSVSANEVIDGGALAAALRSKRLGGCAIDLSDWALADQLPQLPNVVITPGRGWHTPESVESRLRIWIDTLTHYLDGDPIHQVEADTGLQSKM